MRTIILGLSACLSACVASVPVAELDRKPDTGPVIPASEPVDKQKAPGRQDPKPAVTRVALPYAINLESALDSIRLDQVPALPGLDSHLIYTTDHSIRDRIWQRLRVGFFASYEEAEKVRKEVSARYPQAWVTKTNESERSFAQQHGFVAGALNNQQAWIATSKESERLFGQRHGLVAATLNSSGSTAVAEPQRSASPERNTAPVQTTAVATPGTGLKGLEGVPLRGTQEPESDRHADAADKLWLGNFGIGSMAPKPQKVSRDDANTEISYGREEDESVFVRSTHKGGDLFTMGTAFTQRHEISDLEARADDEQGYWNMNINSAEGGAGPAFEAEFAQSAFDPETSEGFGSSQNRMLRLKTFGSWQGYQLGLGYQAVGTEFDKGGKAADKRKNNAGNPKTELRKGRQGTEAWVSRQFGNLGIKTVAGLYQDQADEDGGASQFTTQQLGASLNYTILSWPQVGVTLDYANGVRSSSGESAGVQSTEADVQRVASSLYYSDSSWNGTLYVEDATGAGTSDVMDLRTYYVGGSYYPVSTFSLSPGLSYVQENYTDFGAKTDSYTGSLTASYKPSDRSRFSFNGYSEYSTQKNADWALDTEYYYSSLGVNWVSDKPKPLIKQWSFEVFHDQYVDNVYSDSSTGGLGFWFTLKSSPSPINRFVNEVR
jgi:hypothetical protein